MLPLAEDEDVGLFQGQLLGELSVAVSSGFVGDLVSEGAVEEQMIEEEFEHQHQYFMLSGTPVCL